MDTETINGLHSCKPGNEPVVGQSKTFAVTDMPAKDGKKPWIKIKNAGPDFGGVSYNVLSVKPAGFTDSHGNLYFNLEIESVSGESSTNVRGPQAVQSAEPPIIGIQSATPKDDYWSRKELRDIEAQVRMGRCHSQEMALRYFSLKADGTTPDTDKLREMINWFERDMLKSQYSEPPKLKLEQETF